MIEVAGLTKKYGSKTPAVDWLDFRVPSRDDHRLPRPERRGQVDDAPRLLGLVEPDAGSATSSACRTASSTRRASASARCSRPRGPSRALRAQPPARARRRRRRCRVAGRRGDGARRADGAGEAPRKGYSLGMRQRLGLAAALLGDPEVLVLDEPANGLDPQGIRWLRDFLRSLAAEGRTILVSSHVLAEVAQTVDRRRDHPPRPARRRRRRWPRCSRARRARHACGRPEASGCASCSAAQGATRRRGGRRADGDASPERVGELAAANGDRPARARRRARDARGGLPRADRRGDDRVIALVRSELLKLRTTRTLVAYAGRDRRCSSVLGAAGDDRLGAPASERLGRVPVRSSSTSPASRSSSRSSSGSRSSRPSSGTGRSRRRSSPTPRRERVSSAKAARRRASASARAARARCRARASRSSGSAIVDGRLELGDGESARGAQAFLARRALGRARCRRSARLVHSQVGGDRRHARLVLRRRAPARRPPRRSSTSTVSRIPARPRARRDRGTGAETSLLRLARRWPSRSGSDRADRRRSASVRTRRRDIT